MDYLKYFSFGIILFCNATSFAQSVTTTDLIADIEDYGKKIIHKHAHPFNYITKEQFLDSLQEFKRIAGSLNEDQLIVGYIRLNALLKDAHTAIKFPEKDEFPIETFWFEEGFYVSYTSIKYVEYLGSKLTGINGIPIDSVVKLLIPLIGTNNPSWIKHSLPYLLNNPVILYGLKIIPEKEFATYSLLKGNDTIQLRVKSDNIFEKNYQPIHPEKPLLRNASYLNYWYEYDDKKNSIYMNYRQCIEIPEKPFSKFITNFLEDYRKHIPSRIIFDLRYNSGGSPRILKPLLDSLSKEIWKNNTKIFVLAGRHTISAAVINAYELKSRFHAILLGEETGGNLNHPGYISFFTLKHTDLKVYYSTWDSYFDSTVKGGILPDSTFLIRYSDIIQGIDPPLEAAYSWNK